MRGHLFFDTSTFAVADNHLADTVAAESVSAVGGVKCDKKRTIVLSNFPFLQPIGDSPATVAEPKSIVSACVRVPLPRIRNVLLAGSKVTNTQLADFVSSQSITPQQRNKA
jgi:hypothetical protein